MKFHKKTLIAAIGILATGCSMQTTETTATITDRPLSDSVNTNYTSNRNPLKPLSFIKLPAGSIEPKGWLRKMLELQRNGLSGRLGEISAWLEKKNNAWLEDGGDHGWEEVPYWLRGYSNLGYVLNDTTIVNETRTWLESAFARQQPDGYFGPINLRNGKREIWGQMLMLYCMQSYYEYTGDSRVIDFMTRYCRWLMQQPDDQLLEDYWENSRGGDNITTVLWLYNITGEPFLLDLALKIHRNTADWTQPTSLPNWHNVNIAECFREPATIYMVTGDSTQLKASYNVHSLIRRTFGQVPGGMFGADENARLGYIDPRQGIETCGMVEQMFSDELMLAITGDPMWADNCEDVAFNTFPAAMMPDMKALRYITAPNHTISDSRNHHPSIDNSGPFLAMNPFSSRCCQHNHGFGWPMLAQNLIMATPDNGAAAVIYSACTADITVGNNRQISISEETSYPFGETIALTVSTEEKVKFPLYLRIPSWCTDAKASINGKPIGGISIMPGKYLRLDREWANGDKVELTLPMKLAMRTWPTNKNSVSIDYGPLTLSLKINERYEQVDSRTTAIGDSQWQENADAEKWPGFEIYPDSPWNYSIVLNRQNPLANMEVIKKVMPSDSMPFSLSSVPLEVKAMGRKIPSWGYDDTGMCSVLPDEDAPRGETEEITLVPMGAARLRIAAFPATHE